MILKESYTVVLHCTKWDLVRLVIWMRSKQSKKYFEKVSIYDADALVLLFL